MLYFVYDPAYTLHLTGPRHPEQPARAFVINQALEHAGLKTAKNTILPRFAEEEEILLCHTPEYYLLVQKEVQKLREREIGFLSTGDAIISPASFEIARLAVGGVLHGIDKVMTERDAKVFAIVRPPGHHATSDRGMGFCIFNNAAIGVRYVQKKYGVQRVLIVDWDVHHGNGTQDIFYEDPSVYYFSTHELGNYPNTGAAEEIGAGAGKGYNLNIPILPGNDSREKILEAYTNILTKKMEAFRPEFIIISAGFDGHKDDPLGHFNLTDDDFGTLTEVTRGIAEQYGFGRIISILEGGYNLHALASASIMHAKNLMK